MCYAILNTKVGEKVSENKKDTNEYQGEVVTEKEERFAKNSNKKALIIIMRCLLGIFGVDKFIMGCKKKGIQDLIITGATIAIPITSLLLIVVPYVGYGLFSMVLFFTNIVTIIRILYSFISGLRMIKLTPREIAQKYESMM